MVKLSVSQGSSESKTAVAIVSVFGRGNWLASRLRQEQIPFRYYDLTHKMGIWPPEDLAGPLGLFINDQLTDLQRETIFSEDAYEEIANGFTVLLRHGPLEFKGPLTQFHMKKLGFADFMLDDEKWRLLQKNSVQLSFQKTWPIHLANYLPATRDFAAPEAAHKSESLSLGVSFHRRIPLRNSVEKSLQWLESQGGGAVFRNKNILDFSKKGPKWISGFEIQGEGLDFCDQLVWCLSSEETYFVDPRLGGTLYPRGTRESLWSWLRFRVLFENNSLREEIPSHFCLIGDLEAPWTHENLMIILATGSVDQYDIWVKAPTLQRFNKDYLIRLGDKIMQVLYYKLGELGCRLQSYPQEYYYTYSQIGAPRFPVFPGEYKPRSAALDFRNVHAMSPEQWTQMNWQGQFSHAENVFHELRTWWNLVLQNKKQDQKQDKKNREVDSEDVEK